MPNFRVTVHIKKSPVLSSMHWFHYVLKTHQLWQYQWLCRLHPWSFSRSNIWVLPLGALTSTRPSADRPTCSTRSVPTSRTKRNGTTCHLAMNQKMILFLWTISPFVSEFKITKYSHFHERTKPPDFLPDVFPSKAWSRSRTNWKENLEGSCWDC